MAEQELKEKCEGRIFRVIHCRGALASFNEAISHIPQKNKKKKFTYIMMAQIMRVANGDTLSSNSFKKEGNLPGRNNRKSFYAFKRIPIRGYCWRSDTHHNTYFISHYIFKDQNSLDQKDTKRVQTNWNRIEVQGHDN